MAQEGLDDLRISNEEYSITEQFKQQNGVMTIKDILQMLSQLIKSANIFKQWRGDINEMKNSDEDE